MNADLQAIKARLESFKRPPDHIYGGSLIDDIDALIAEVEQLTQERDTLAAEVAGYKRQAQYISECVDSEGVYRP